MDLSRTKNRYFLSEIPVDDVADTIVDKIILLAESRGQKIVNYINPHVYYLALRDRSLKKFLVDADLIYADGWGIVLALRFLGNRIAKRITTADFFDDFCHQAQSKGLSMGFLGGDPRTSRKAIEKIKCKFPHLRIVLISHGFFRPGRERAIIARIRKVATDILIVGLGTPKQEVWVQKMKGELSAKVIWCVGSLMDYYGGRPLAPRFLGAFKLEWVFRLLTEPRRLWKRYTWENFWFVWHVFCLKLRNLSLRQELLKAHK